ncbi:MAG: enoyl-CoA hydratase/isomerase family protein [Anaerolineales bacterium]|nr:enoyl-CoA hydratase/isomerase family protein [Anaerolineales bacterium]
MTESFISVETKNGASTLTLRRAPLNVLDIATLTQFESALAELTRDESIRVLVVKAEGKMFSAGVDVADHTPDKVGGMIPLFDRVCRALANFPAPTIAVVHGHALGGGCELVLCCDLAVMTDNAKIGQPEIQLAAIAPIAALRLPQLVGYRDAADILFTGRSLTADEALKMGLVNAVVSAEQLEQWVEDKVTKFTSLSRVALTMTKRALHIGFGAWDSSAAELERLYLDELMKTEDAHEGLAAFMEKRAAVWKHK